MTSLASSSVPARPTLPPPTLKSHSYDRAGGTQLRTCHQWNAYDVNVLRLSKRKSQTQQALIAAQLTSEAS